MQCSCCFPTAQATALCCKATQCSATVMLVMLPITRSRGANAIAMHHFKIKRCGGMQSKSMQYIQMQHEVPSGCNSLQCTLSEQQCPINGLTRNQNPVSQAAGYYYSTTALQWMLHCSKLDKALVSASDTNTETAML